MNTRQFTHIHQAPGFIAALDQSGGSTPNALAAYGLSRDAYTTEKDMYRLVHAMRTRIIISPAFADSAIIGAILFKMTMRDQIDGLAAADYLWQKKGVVPFLKIDNGLADRANGVQLMKPMPELGELLSEAVEKHIFGTKMRSLIHDFNSRGIQQVLDQQFAIAREILAAGLVPIIEPEVSLAAPNRAEIETELLTQLTAKLDSLDQAQNVMLKLSIPVQDDLYKSLIAHPRVVRVVALSGGYSRDEANQHLSRNHGLIASFSRALAEGLSAQQTDEEFNAQLQSSIDSIYRASVAS